MGMAYKSPAKTPQEQARRDRASARGAALLDKPRREIWAEIDGLTARIKQRQQANETDQNNINILLLRLRNLGR